MQVRQEPAKLETGHSDPWVATLVVASKASGINILGNWLPGLPLVQLSFSDSRNKRSLEGQPVRAHGGEGLQHPNKQLTQARQSKLHRLATEALQKGDCISSLWAPAASTCQELLERLRTGGLEQTRRGDL